MLLFLQITPVESRPRQARQKDEGGIKNYKRKEPGIPLEEPRQITAWHDRKLLPGQPWDGVIRAELDCFDLVLLLVELK